MADKLGVWVCAQCGAKHWPQVVKAAGKCPSCGNASGEVKQLSDEERNAGA